MRNGTVTAVRSSTKNLFNPPLKVSFALSCQSVVGKPTLVDVSSNFRRVLFAFSLAVASPYDSGLVQSAPAQTPPLAETSSVNNVCGDGRRLRRSILSGETIAPFAIVNEPDCATASE